MHVIVAMVLELGFLGHLPILLKCWQQVQQRRNEIYGLGRVARALGQQNKIESMSRYAPSVGAS